MNLLRAGGLLGFLAVALGAFGTHALRGRMSEDMLKVWQTGTQYQLIHAVVILMCGWVAMSTGSKKVGVAGWLIATGVIVFSGSLYVLSWTGIMRLGAVTPLGGLLMLAGWLLLVLAAPEAKFK